MLGIGREGRGVKVPRLSNEPSKVKYTLFQRICSGEEADRGAKESCLLCSPTDGGHMFPNESPYISFTYCSVHFRLLEKNSKLSCDFLEPKLLGNQSDVTSRSIPFCSRKFICRRSLSGSLLLTFFPGKEKCP